MVETGTVQLSPLVGRARFDDMVDTVEQNTAAHFLTDNVGYRYVFARLLPEDDLRSNHGADEPLHHVSGASVLMRPICTPWYQIPNAPRLTEQSFVERSNYRIVWSHSYESSLQDNRATWSFALHTSEATSSRLFDFLADVEDASAKVWTDLLRDLSGWEETVVDDRGQEQLAVMLRASFEVDSVEDGMQHPAEEIIAEALRSAKDQRVLEWLRAFCTDASQPSFAASVLRCLGRHGSVGTVSWRVSLVRDGLAMHSAEIRDAAVQAAETWGDSDLLAVLGSHSDPEPWLRQYIFDVIDDLAR